MNQNTIYKSGKKEWMLWGAYGLTQREYEADLLRCGEGNLMLIKNMDSTHFNETYIGQLNKIWNLYNSTTLHHANIYNIFHFDLY